MKHSATPWRARTACAALALALLGLSSCGDDSTSTGSDAGQPSSSAPQVKEECTVDRVGGVLDIGTWAETASLDPVGIVGGTSGGPETAAIFDTLMRYNPSTQKNEPWVAESLEPNSDRTEWTLKLRPNVKFGNGDPLTADAVKASIARHQDPANKSRFGDLVAPIKEIQVRDNLTAVFVMKQADATLPNVLTDAPGMITNPNVVTQLGDKFKTMPVGAGVGPYEPTKFAPGEEVAMKARSNYWAGPVCIPEIHFRVGPNDSFRQQKFATGDYQLTWLRDPLARDAVKSNAHNEDPAFNLVRNSGGILGINNAKQPLDNVKVRQALTVAIDANVVTERGFQGKSRPSKSLIDSKSALYSADMKPQDYDAKRAQALVAELKAAGIPTTFDMMCPSTAADYGLAVKTMLEQAGFTINLDSAVPVQTFIQKVNVEKNYTLSCQGLNIDDASPWIAFGRFLGSTSASNFLNYKNADMDKAIAGMKNSASLDELKRYVADAQKVFNETYPAAALFPAEQLTVVAPKLKGIVPTSQSIVLFGRAYLQK